MAIGNAGGGFLSYFGVPSEIWAQTGDVETTYESKVMHSGETP